MLIKVSTTADLFAGMLLLARAMSDTVPEPEPMEEEERKPFLFPDEIAEILRSAGKGADVMIGHERRTYYGEFMKSALIMAIYDAIEEGRRVTVNGQNILDM